MDRSHASSAVTTPVRTESPEEEVITSLPERNGNPFTSYSNSPYASNLQSARGSSTGFNSLRPRYFHSRRIDKTKVERPWLDKSNRDPREKWVWILPLIGIVAGLAVAGFLIYDGLSGVTNHVYCPVLDADFSAGATLDPKVWLQEVEAGGFGYVAFIEVIIFEFITDWALATASSRSRRMTAKTPLSRMDCFNSSRPYKTRNLLTQTMSLISRQTISAPVTSLPIVWRLPTPPTAPSSILSSRLGSTQVQAQRSSTAALKLLPDCPQVTGYGPRFGCCLPTASTAHGLPLVKLTSWRHAAITTLIRREVITLLALLCISGRIPMMMDGGPTLLSVTLSSLPIARAFTPMGWNGARSTCLPTSTHASCKLFTLNSASPSGPVVNSLLQLKTAQDSQIPGMVQILAMPRHLIRTFTSSSMLRLVATTVGLRMALLASRGSTKARQLPRISGTPRANGCQHGRKEAHR